ncbi:MAG TPA: 3-deoxy-8-phosphooctulonate synthase [Longimicrobium sp.]|nr:3-deoxy-8-phosphooctulonate synthase [Longimicrobium sp.]
MGERSDGRVHAAEVVAGMDLEALLPEGEIVVPLRGGPVVRSGPDVAKLFRIGAPFWVIAGPCVLESDALNLTVAEALARLGDDLGVPIVFKASFDKANRSSPGSPRGPGVDDGLRKLERVRAATGLPLLTDVHLPDQCQPVAEVVDVLQIPAFLCRQTDLLLAAGATGKPVNVKKGQWMGPAEMKGAAAKVRGAGAPGVAVTERGTFFGYGNLVVDMRSFALMREACEAPAIFDGTHSVQRPGEGQGVSGGEPGHIPALVRAAVAAGADALFLETHPDPAKGLSDTTNMLPLDRLRPLLEQVLEIRAAVRPFGWEAGARG